MKKTLAGWIADSWYKESWISLAFLPLSLIYAGAVWCRKKGYAFGVLKKERLPVPVIVVGNITVGGTGKTPLIIRLAELLKDAGYRPGVISRGYGGQAKTWPQWVNADSNPKTVGDEALLIAVLTGCPMAVGPIRADAGKMLLEKSNCNVILSDDGLQHYALDRDIEIAVIDGSRRFGNGYCLPSGPLREPVSRLKTVNFIVVNGGTSEDNAFSMHMQGDLAVNVATGQQKPLQEFTHRSCHAVAGIGNPGRFFKQLESAGLHCKNHAFSDHYAFQPMDIEFDDDLPVLMTEKDAVKCKAFATPRHWRIPVKAVLESGFSERLLQLLREKHGR